MRYFIIFLFISSYANAEVKPWELDWSKAKPKQQQMNCTCTVVQPETPKAQVEEDIEQREPQQEEEN